MILKVFLQLGENIDPVGGTHARAEVRRPWVVDRGLALLEDREGFALGIRDDQATPKRAGFGEG